MLNTPLQLPCGAVLQNRLCKAAMTERLSNKDYAPNDEHFQLYDTWADSNSGLMISGNVLIDKRHMESAGNIVVDDEGIIPMLQKWTTIATKNGHHFWVQINHSGRQTSRLTNMHPHSASDVQLHKMGFFGKPKAMTESHIEEVIRGFVRAADICKKGGFTGVQIHAAHGYLLSQFLSPITNKRRDQWGGSLENRSRLLRSIVREVRDKVGAEYPISVKLNSADFQRGGFTEEESLEVVQMLATEKIDLLEISGGTYEQVEFFTRSKQDIKASTRRREAYFLDFASKVRQLTQLPLMVTGGFRSYAFAEEALQNGELDVVGMARPFLTQPDKINDFLQGRHSAFPDPKIRTGIKMLEDSAEAGFYALQILRLGKGKQVKLDYSPMYSAMFMIWHEFVKMLGKRF